MDRFIFTARGDDMPEMNEHRPSALPTVMVPAMAYVPIQFYDTVFSPEEAFECGTLFPELALPFTGCDPK